MTKLKTVYHCSQCGAQSPKWMGQCPDCQAWDSFSESVKSASQPKSARFSGYAGQSAPQVLQLDQVVLTQQNRVPTGLQELDLVLGGGLL